MSQPEATTEPVETRNDVDAATTARNQQGAIQRPLGAIRQRWDTEVSQIEVRGNEAANRRHVAATTVARWPECKLVLSVYSAGVRGPHGYVVWNVEWVATWTEVES